MSSYGIDLSVCLVVATNMNHGLHRLETQELPFSAGLHSMPKTGPRCIPFCHIEDRAILSA